MTVVILIIMSLGRQLLRNTKKGTQSMTFVFACIETKSQRLECMCQSNSVNFNVKDVN